MDMAAWVPAMYRVEVTRHAVNRYNHRIRGWKQRVSGREAVREIVRLLALTIERRKRQNREELWITPKARFVVKVKELSRKIVVISAIYLRPEHRRMLHRRRCVMWWRQVLYLNVMARWVGRERLLLPRAVEVA